MLNNWQNNDHWQAKTIGNDQTTDSSLAGLPNIHFEMILNDPKNQNLHVAII